MNGLYMLKGQEPVVADDVEEWAKWFDDGQNRIVEQTPVKDYLVSTVFLGMDHRYGLSDGPPILFETMIFPEVADTEYQERYETWGAAEDGHAQAVAWLNSQLEESAGGYKNIGFYIDNESE